MNEWKTVRLGDVCILEKGQQIDTSLLDDSKPYRYINGGIKESGYFDNFNTSGESVLISEGGASCGYINYVNENFWCGCHCYRLHDIKVFPKYLFHALKANQQRIMALRTGSAMPNIQKSTIQKFELKIHDDSTSQKKVAIMLDKCNELIEKHKQTLEKYDMLIKSRFIEMFGDPTTNPMNWEIKPMGELLSILTDFSSNGSYKTLDSNVIMYDEPNYALMIRTTDLESGDFSNNVKWVDEKAYNLLSKSKVFGNEIIMNKIGSAGKVYLMPELNRPVTLGRNAFLFRYKESINSVYIYFLLTSEYGQNEIKPYIRGAVTKTITKDDARKIRIPVPPITLQNKFATFVQQIDKSKFAVQKALEKAETLYKSLMQQYFA